MVDFVRHKHKHDALIQFAQFSGDMWNVYHWPIPLQNTLFVISYSVTYCVYIPGKPGFCVHYCCAVYDECKYSDTFWSADRIRLFVHYTISLSSLCKLICRHWTYKMPVRYVLSSVWVRLSIFSQLSIIQYMGLCVFSLPIPLRWLREYIYFVLLSSSNRKYELLPIV